MPVRRRCRHLCSSAAAGATACAGAASCWVGLSATGISGSAVSGCDEFFGHSADSRFGRGRYCRGFGLGRCRGGFRFSRLRVTSASAGRRLVAGCAAGAATCDAGPALSRSTAGGIDVQHRQNGRVRASVWLCAKIGFSEPRATTECWQIPRAPRATTPRRQVRTPVSTSTTRSRRTENESPGAWTPSSAFAGSAKALSQRERGDDRIRRVPNAAGTASAQRIRLISRIPQRFRGRLLKIGAVELPPFISLGRIVSKPVRLRGNGVPESSQMPEPGPNWPDLS